MLTNLLATIKCIAAIALVAFLSHPAAAVCPNTLPPDEQALWDTHNCDRSFRSWFRDAFNLQKKHWDEGWGWDDCDPRFAFPKMLNAGFLIRYGLDDEVLGPWHNVVDYSAWASGRRHGFRYEPEDSTENWARAQDGFWQTDLVEMMCPSFDKSAGIRAGGMLHEATHIIYYKYKHKDCGDKCWDDWLFHVLGQYPYGKLVGNKHSMYQIEVEFTCDLSEFPDPWVPATIVTQAQAESNNLMNNYIIKQPGWTCGIPRPGSTRPPPPQPPPLCESGEKCCQRETPPETGCVLCVPLHTPCPSTPIPE